MKLSFKAAVAATLGVVLAACAEPSTELLSGPDLKPGNGKGGGGGGGGETALRAEFLTGSGVTNQHSLYRDGDDGVTAHITSDGSLSFIATDPSGFVVGDIDDADGLLVEAPGLVDARLQTFSCCDLRAMTRERDGVQMSGDTLDMKLLLVWTSGGGEYRLSFGSSSCGDGSMASDDPVRGSWALVTRDTLINAPDTTWTIESDPLGVGALCRSSGGRGPKNSSLDTLSVTVSTAVRFEVRTLWSQSQEE